MSLYKISVSLLSDECQIIATYKMLPLLKLYNQALQKSLMLFENNLQWNVLKYTCSCLLKPPH